MTLSGVLYGHGHMGRLHAEKLRARTDVHLAIIDPAAGFRETGPGTPDFAIIATPTRSHAEVAAPLLASGIPCLIEKPLAPSVALAEVLAAHDHLAVGHIERFNPVFTELPKSGIAHVSVERLSPPSDRSADVDVIDDLMIHDLDLLLHWIGGEVTDLRANGLSVSGEKLDMVNARIELRQPSGDVAVANVTASRVSTHTVRTWRAFAPGQYWSLDLHKRTGKYARWGADPVPMQIPSVDPLQAQHDAFLSAVRGERDYPCSGRDGLRALLLAEAVRQCLR